MRVSESTLQLLAECGDHSAHEVVYDVLPDLLSLGAIAKVYYHSAPVYSKIVCGGGLHIGRSMIRAA